MSGSCASVAEKQTPTEDLAEWQDSCATDEHESLTQWPTHGTTGTDSEMCSTVAKDDDTLLSCEFDCGPPMPRKNMINKGQCTEHMSGVVCLLLFNACHHQILGFAA